MAGDKPSMAIRVAADLATLKKNLAEGRNQIETTTAAMQKLASSLDGSKLEQRAHNIAAAINEVGGATKLTDAEAARHLRTLDAWIDKAQRLGKDVPADMLKMREELVRLEEPTSRAAKLVQDLKDQVKATALGFISAQAIIGGVKTVFGTLTQFVGDSVQSYANAEAAAKKMTVALQAQGTATPAAVAQMNDLAAQFQRTTVYSDDLINEMEALLVQVGNVAPGEMNKALTAATDLASGLGVDLQTATMLVGKAFAGETGTLSRYGIVIDEAKLKAEGLPAVLDAIRQRFGGQAQSEVDTYAGRLKQLANEWDNFKESVGETIATNPILEAALRVVKERVEGGTTAVKDHEHSLSDLLRRLNVFGENAPNIVARFVRSLEDSAAASNSAAKAAAFNANTIRPMASHLDEQTAALQRQREEQKKKAEADKAAAEASKRAADAAKKHAEAIQALSDRLSGGGAIQAARDMVVALRSAVPVQHMTADAQAEINKTMDAAIEVYRAQGRVAPQAMRDLWMETQKTIPVIDGLGESLNGIGREVKLDIPAIKDWSIAWKEGLQSLPGLHTEIFIPKPKVSGFAAIFGDAQKFGQEMAATIQGAIQGGGNVAAAGAGMVGGKIGSHIAASLAKNGGKFFQSALGEVFTGAIPVVGSLIGPLAGAVWNKLFGSAGRDKVVEFANTFAGGFDGLQAQLTRLGAEGERLWQQLTQGTGRNNPEQASRNIQAVQQALATIPPTMAELASQAGYQTTEQLQKTAQDAVRLWEYMRDSGQYSAEAVQQAWERAQEALHHSGDAQVQTVQTALDAAKGALKTLDDQIASLQKSIENEAPEEVMGVVEAQARARLEALQKERDAAAKHVEELQDKLTESMDRVAAAIEQIPHDIEIRVRTTMDAAGVPESAGGPAPIPQADGGDWWVTKPTLFLAGEAGPERATFTPAGRGGASGGTRQPIVIQIGSRTLWEGLIDVAAAEGLA